MASSAPAFSPESTRLQYRSSKCFGCLRKDAAKPEPEEISFRMVTTSSCKPLFSRPSATMSKLCTNGTPAFIMVASWRVSMAMSNGVIFLLPPNNGLDFFLTLSGITPCLRNWALARAILDPIISPLDALPFRSLPAQTYVSSLCDFSAMLNPSSRGWLPQGWSPPELLSEERTAEVCGSLPPEPALLFLWSWLLP